MGVHGLWDLLAPVGRRVSVETLAGKRLAIDASIWMIQFMKAMRDEKGEMVSNAHLLGFFRRICKLLYLRTKPIFVFDGGTPALKRRTVIARRRQRENAQAKIRKTAEKMLLNQLKQMKLKELADELEKQRKDNDSKTVATTEELEKQNKGDDSKGKKVITDEAEMGDAKSGGSQFHADRCNQEALDEMLAASLLAEEDEVFTVGESSSGLHAQAEDEDADEDEEMILPTMHGKVDPAILAALPPSMQLDLLVQMGERSMAENRQKYQKVEKDPARFSELQIEAYLKKVASRREVDEVQKSAAGQGIVGSSSGLHSQAEDEDEDEEMILPTMDGKVDPAVLAALPPSMQLDLLVQMRERLMAENRQKYQKVKKVPARFSELQIEAYLKTVAFRREIDEVQKSAAGRGIGGVQTSRIASEANREFIFSSSFSGDKQVLTATGEGRKMSNSNLTSSSAANTVDVTLIKNSIAAAGSADNEPQMDLDNDIETYLDERGRLRVSRVRAMGIRMTRDIQRNLDFMKELEKERGVATENAIDGSTIGRIEVEAMADSENGIQLFGDSDHNTDGKTNVNTKDEKTALNTGSAIEISFENNGSHEHADDDLFARLVAGDPVMDFSVDNSPSKKQCSDSASECEWEEGNTLCNDVKVDSKPLLSDEGMVDDNELEWEEGGDFSIDVKVDKTPVLDGDINLDRELVQDECGTFGNDIKVGSKLLEAAGGMNDGSEIVWNEGSSDIQEKASSCPAECWKITSKGDVEEEADLQEAIRLSLLDLDDKRSLHALREHKKSRAAAEMSFSTNLRFLHEEDPNKQEISSEGKFEEQNPVSGFIKRIDDTVESNISETSNPLSPPLVSCDGTVGTSEKTCQRSTEGLLVHDASDETNLLQEVLVDSVAEVQEKDVSQISEQLACTSGTVHHHNGLNAAMDGCSSETTVLGKASGGDPIKGMDTTQEAAGEEASDYIPMEKVEPIHSSAPLDGKKQIEIMEASVEEEMLILGEEERELGDERRKLERNAESVSSEMFTECQELLQIFGLPFIIAPMEAEAQCAYMELNNLVDGVVTDDSDTFLFGAQSVYKNIFDDRKYVETYFMKDIENELGLNREKLINMALLLGSDYTEGVSGIGIVNAIEVVTAFPEEDGLRKFREWIESPDPSILGKYEAKAGVNSKKRESKVGDTDMSCSDSKEIDETQKIKQIFMDKHRNVSKNWHIPSSFPSDAVISAYISPQVDKSTEPFSWGKPDHFIFRKLCWEKFGWSTQKTDELLLPVLNEYNKRETQLRLEAFYTFNERFAKIRSKRIKKALKGISQHKSLNLIAEPGSSGKKRTVNQGDAIGESEKTLEGQCFEDAENKPDCKEESIEKKSRKKKAKRESLHAVQSRKRSSIEIESCENQSEVFMHKGRGRGKARNESIGKRMKKNGSPLKCAESCSHDESNSYDGNESQVKFERQCQVRRSERSRKKVDYTMSDSISDGSYQDDGNSQNEKSEGRASSADFLDAGDAVTNPSKINRGEIVDHEFPQECLEKGAWLCTEKTAPETRVIESSSSKNDDILAAAQLSNDYLAMGGGFCLDEDDADVNSGGLASPTRATTLDSKKTADDTTDINDCSLLQKIPLDGDTVNESGRSLRAMPNLRKRRRKS